MDVTRLLVIRHGETAWNKDTRIQGQTDIPLNEVGHWQAQQTALALAQEPIAAVYSSDLLRAYHTAAPIAQALGLPVQTEQALRERHFGVGQGRTWAELEQDDPEMVRQWKARLPDFAPATGESLNTLKARVEAVVHRLAAHHRGEQIVLVAHGGVLDIIYRMATQLPVDSPRTWLIANASINRVLWHPDGMSMVGWADVGHLSATETRDEQAA